MSDWLQSRTTRGWQTASKETAKHAALWRQPDAEAAKHRIEWIWVKGHAGHAENERCDELARQGVDAARKAGKPVEFSVANP